MVGSVVADGDCATEQCEKARKISNLPADVKSFAEQRDGCDYFRSEPWPEGSGAAAKERRDFISKSLKKFCIGTDKRLQALRKKYRNDRVVIELLQGYEDDIEAG